MDTLLKVLEDVKKVLKEQVSKAKAELNEEPGKKDCISLKNEFTGREEKCKSEKKRLVIRVQKVEEGLEQQDKEKKKLNDVTKQTNLKQL